MPTNTNTARPGSTWSQLRFDDLEPRIARNVAVELTCRELSRTLDDLTEWVAAANTAAVIAGEVPDGGA